MQQKIPAPLPNPYEHLYRSYNLATGQSVTRGQAEDIARHLGFMHNAIACVIRDFIDVIKFRFPNQDSRDSEPSQMQEEGQEIAPAHRDAQERGPTIQWRQQFGLQGRQKRGEQFNEPNEDQNSEICIEISDKVKQFQKILGKVELLERIAPLSLASSTKNNPNEDQKQKYEKDALHAVINLQDDVIQLDDSDENQ